MDFIGAGHLWGDDDRPPQPGRFPQSDGTCWEVESQLEQGSSHAYPSALRQPSSCLLSASMALFSTQPH